MTAGHGTTPTGIMADFNMAGVLGFIGGLDIGISGLDAGTEVIVGPYQVLRDLRDGDAVRAG